MVDEIGHAVVTIEPRWKPIRAPGTSKLMYGMPTMARHLNIPKLLGPSVYRPRRMDPKYGADATMFNSRQMIQWEKYLMEMNAANKKFFPQKKKYQKLEIQWEKDKKKVRDKAKRRGVGGAGLLEFLGISGMAPYARFGKRGIYGGVSGINLGKMSAALGAVVAILVVLTSIWKAIKETETFKWMKALFDLFIGAVLSVYGIVAISVGKVVNVLTWIWDMFKATHLIIIVFVKTFGVFIAAMGTMIESFTGWSGLKDLGVNITKWADEYYERKATEYGLSNKKAPTLFDVGGQGYPHGSPFALSLLFDMTKKLTFKQIFSWSLDNLLKPRSLVTSSKDYLIKPAWLLSWSGEDKIRPYMLLGGPKFTFGSLFDPKTTIPFPSVFSGIGTFMTSMSSVWGGIAGSALTKFDKYFLYPLSTLMVSVINSMITAVNVILPKSLDIPMVKYPTYEEPTKSEG